MSIFALQIYIIIMLVGGILTIISLLWDRSVYKNISNIRDIRCDMPKIIQDVTKPPKSLKQFWEIFVGNDKWIQNKFKRNEKKLKKIENKIDDISKHQNWRTGLAIVVFIAMCISIGVAYGGIVGVLHPPPEHVREAFLTAHVSVYRWNDTQSCIVKIQNTGDKSAENLEIEIDFPSNMTIYNIINDGGTPLPETKGGINHSYYYPAYKNIKEHENITFNILLNNNRGDFVIEESWGVPPKRVQIWADGNLISFSKIYTWEYD